MGEQRPAADGGLRILADLAVGEERTGIRLRLEIDTLDAYLPGSTEPNDLFTRDHVLPPSQAISLTHQTRPVVLGERRATRLDTPAVGRQPAAMTDSPPNFPCA